MVPEIRRTAERIFSQNFGLFFALLQFFEKKKMPGYNHFTQVHNK